MLSWLLQFRIKIIKQYLRSSRLWMAEILGKTWDSRINKKQENKRNLWKLSRKWRFQNRFLSIWSIFRHSDKYTLANAIKWLYWNWVNSSNKYWNDFIVSIYPLFCKRKLPIRIYKLRLCHSHQMWYYSLYAKPFFFFFPLSYIGDWCN